LINKKNANGLHGIIDMKLPNRVAELNIEFQ